MMEFFWEPRIYYTSNKNCNHQHKGLEVRRTSNWKEKKKNYRWIRITCNLVRLSIIKKIKKNQDDYHFLGCQKTEKEGVLTSSLKHYIFPQKLHKWFHTERDGINSVIWNLLEASCLIGWNNGMPSWIISLLFPFTCLLKKMKVSPNAAIESELVIIYIQIQSK